MADTSTNKVSYYNTLIFTIISGLISLILLVCLVMKVFDSKYMLFIILLECGIFSVILYCIYKIVINAYRINLLKSSNNVVVTFDTCPDYFSRQLDSHAKTYCSNEYIYEDAGMQKYLIKIYPTTKSPPPIHNPTILDKLVNTNNAPAGPVDKFYINTIELNNELNTNELKCAPIHKDSTDPNGIRGFAEIPWTNVKAKCESYIY
jgi:hypothetical protein